MQSSRTRWIWRASAVFIVMLEAAVPQRVFAQWRPEILPGVRFGPPLKASLAVGVGYGNHMGPSPFAGSVGLADIGLGGARASAGWFFAGPFASGIELLGSAIRTWGNPAQLERNQTLAGGELRASFFLVNVGVAALRPVAGFNDDKRARYYLNIGLGI